MYPFIANHQIKRYFPSRNDIEVVEKSDREAITISSSQRITKNKL